MHKIRDKKHAGFFSGQNIIFLLLVSDTLTITILVGFRFYEPDPDISAWRKEDKRLRKKGIQKNTGQKCQGTIQITQLKYHWQ